MERRVPPGAGPVGHDRPRADQSDRASRTSVAAGTTSRCSCRAGSGRFATSKAATARWSATEIVRGDWPLKPGDVIRIGHTQLVFVHKLSEAFASSGDAQRGGSPSRRADGAAAPATAPTTRPTCWRPREPTTITHRRGQTKFLAPGEEEEDGVSKMGRAAAKLCRLAFELAKAPDVAAMADLALAGLGRRNADRRRRAAAAAGELPGRAARRRPGSRRLAKFLAASLPPRLELPGLDRACARARPCWPAT